MNKTTFLAVGLATLLGAAATTQAQGKQGKGKHKQVLFFTKSSGFEHSAIKVKDGQDSHAFRTLKELADKNGFEVTHSKDGGLFTPEGIAKYDAFVFYTTGDLTKSGTDNNPPMPVGGKEQLLDAIKKGKGFVGVHPASDTFHSPAENFVDDGAGADPYIKMLGGEFIKHGQQQKARIICADMKFPGLGDCPKEGFDLHEEWYSYKNLAKDLHVVQWMATWSLKNTGNDSVYRRPPYPVTWTRKEGKGRVFYTALGHREDVWDNPLFQKMLAGGIRWAAGAVQASTKVDVAQVTPGYAELPPKDPSPPKPAAPAAPAAPKPAAAATAPAAPAAR